MDDHLSLTSDGPSDVHHLEHSLNMSFGLPQQAMLSGHPAMDFSQESPATGKPPIHRWYHESNDAPWHPRNLTTGTEDAGGQPMVPDMSNVQYMVPTRSNVVPSEIMAHSDSGYGGSYRNHTSIANGSVCDESFDANPDTQSIIGGPMGDAQFSMHDTASRNTLTLGGSWDHTIRIEPTKCAVCGKPVRTKSEMKKHDQRHKKPFRCDVKDCARIEGFSTTNDLDRHKRSVHPESQTLGNRYMCQIGNCKSKAKVWPRADNFKAHLKRVHSQDNVTETQLEACIVKQTPQPTQPTSLGPQNDPRQEAMPDFHGSHNLANGQMNQSLFPGKPQPMNSPMPQNHGNMFLASSQQELADLSIPHTTQQQELYYGMIQPAATPQSSINLSPPIRHDQLTQECDTPVSVSVSSYVREPVSPAARGQSIDTQIPGADDSRLILLNEPGRTLSNNPTVCNTPDNLIKGDSGVSDAIEPERLSSQGLRISAFDLGKIDLDPGDEKILIDVLRSRGILARHGYKKEGSEVADPTKTGSDTTTSLGQCHRCPTCNKAFPRKCELKKHEKRHEKPYGCTMPDCDKKFGSKNDWKRHENTQHFMLESWKCDAAGCDKAFYRREYFRCHLGQDHMMTDPDMLEDKLEECRIGRNYEDRFWCGFCEEIIENKQKNRQGWVERFDHIDEHYSGRNGEQKVISEWKNFDTSRRSEEASREDSGDGSQSYTSIRNGKTQYSGRQGIRQAGGQTRPKRKRNDGSHGGSSKKAKALESRGVICICCTCGDLVMGSQVRCNYPCEHIPCVNCKRG